MKQRLAKVHDLSSHVTGMPLAAPAFTERLVPRFPTAPASQAPQQGAAPAEPSGSSPDGAVFSHFTESSCPVSPVDGQDVAPAVVAPSAGALQLCDHSMILLRAVASYERCSSEHAVALALALYATKIGAGPLARAVLDERERLAHGSGEDLAEDLCHLPDFERRQGGRFSRAREALGDDFQGTRR